LTPAPSKTIPITPLPSENNPYTEVHKGHWSSYWKAYLITTVYGIASRFLLQSFMDALKVSPNKKTMAASILMADAVDTLALAGIAECFACTPSACGVEYVAFGSSVDVRIGDADSQDERQQMALKVKCTRALNSDTFVADAKWRQPTMFIVPPMAKVPTNLRSVLSSLKGDETVMLCGEKVIAEAGKALGGFPATTVQEKGWKRAGKYILVDLALAGRFLFPHSIERGI